MAGYRVSQEIRLNKPQWEREKERNTYTYTHRHTHTKQEGEAHEVDVFRYKLSSSFSSDRCLIGHIIALLSRHLADEGARLRIWRWIKGLVYFLCWTDINLSFLMGSTLYLTWPGYSLLVYWIPWLKICQRIKSEALGWQDGSDLSTTDLVTLMTVSFWKYLNRLCGMQIPNSANLSRICRRVSMWYANARWNLA